MPYVRRNDEAEVRATSRWPPSDAPEEFLADDHPDVLAFLDARNPSPAARAATTLNTHPLWIALIDELANARGISREALIAAIVARVP